jgi:protein TonB
LSLCIVSVVAWHRIQGIPASQAHSQPRIEHINAVALPNSPPAAESANVAAVETRTSISPLQASRPIVAPKAETASEAPAKPASITTAAVVATSIPGSIQTSVPTAKPIRIHDAAPTPKVSLSSQNNGLQASRPPLHFVYPDYPDVRARGIVSLTAGLDSNGAVRSVRVVSGNPALAAAAVRAVRQWRYRPYLKDGQPVATETNIVISFISEDAVSMTFPPTIPAVH